MIGLANSPGRAGIGARELLERLENLTQTAGPEIGGVDPTASRESLRQKPLGP
jgi:hypothetical protein